MPNQIHIVLEIGGSREGADYRFIADSETLKRIARQMLDCLENGKPGPWETDSDLILIEEVQLKRGLLRKRLEPAFLSFQKR